MKVVQDKATREHWVSMTGGRWWNMDTETWGLGPSAVPRVELGGEMTSPLEEPSPDAESEGLRHSQINDNSPALDSRLR